MVSLRETISKEKNMKKLLTLLLLLTLCLFTACTSPAEPDELDKTAEQIEQALPEEYIKQSETQVYDFTFSDGQNGNMVYYICLTTYYEASPASVVGLDTNAISAVFDAEHTPVLREFEVSGHSAAIYQGENCRYLCCTSTPEASMVLEYDPDTLSEEDAIKVMESVFSNPAK